MKKNILSFFLFSGLISSVTAQQYWHRVNKGLGSVGTGESVSCLLNDSINHILYACGSFKTADDTISADGIAYWNGSNWYSNFPYPNGATGLPENSALAIFQSMIYCSSKYGAGALFHFDGTAWSNDGNFNGDTYSLCVYHNKLYVGGSFTNVDGMPATFIACYDGTNWSEPGGGVWCTQFPGNVKAMCVWNDKLIVGGSFDQAGGQSVHSVAAWNDTTWSDVGGGVIDVNAPTLVALVNALCVHNGDLIVGGALNQAGSSLAVNNICRWDNSNWFAFGNGVNGSIECLLSFDSSLYVGGNFSSASGASNTFWIAQWESNNQWSHVGTGLEGNPKTFCVYDSTLYVGGYGFAINGADAPGIVRLMDYPDSSLSIKEPQEEGAINIFPNPASDKITIELNNDCNKSTIEVCNLLGEKVMELQATKCKNEIELNGIPSGVYFISVSNERVSWVRKVVIE